ncbi:MAG: hypothetical protein OEW11_08360 [Nitrospirota bacterium]|nr:hypothetical protein [Nitrospirota bacterium]
MVYSVAFRKAWPFYALLTAGFGAIPFLVREPLIWPAMLVGWGGMMVWMLLSRELLTRDHRLGIRLVRKKRFAEAIPRFEAAHAFMERHPWIDRWRSVVLLSNSGMSYREMALLNVAFCYSQIGRTPEAVGIYERVHREFPDNGLAITTLNMLRGL